MVSANDTSLDIAKRQAIEMAYLYAVSESMPIIVYKTNEGVSVVTKDEPMPKDAKVVYMAQRWDSDTIQVRSKGGFSEFVTLFDKVSVGIGG